MSKLIKLEVKEVFSDVTETQGIIGLQIQYANKLEALEETDKFLDTYNLPELDWEAIECLIWSKILCGVEAVIESQHRKTWMTLTHCWFLLNVSLNKKGEEFF